MWAAKGADGMPNSLCRLKAVMGSSGKSARRAFSWALLAFGGWRGFGGGDRVFNCLSYFCGCTVSGDVGRSGPLTPGGL